MKIKAILENHKDRWLAIRVSRFGKNNIPLEGELIAEDEVREKLWKKVPQDKKKASYILFSGDYLEEGYAAAF